MKPIYGWIFCLAFAAALGGCRPAVTSPEPNTPATTTPATITPATNTPAASLTPEATLTPTLTPTATLTATPATLEVCSPLAGVPLDELTGRISNPYAPPPPGSDDPHYGIDLVDELPGSQVAVTGLEVDAVLAGRVAAVVDDRFPYGNAVFIETTLDAVPADWPGQAALPTPGPTLVPNSALTCPTPEATPEWDSTRRSLYLVYAHMLDAPSVQVGDSVACGEALGKIGQTGNALNPHLHLEVRSGPAGARFSCLAHYDNSATHEEMANYCLWRISGWFQSVDPVAFLGLK